MTRSRTGVIAPVSVVIPTRNRGADVVPAVHSVLASSDDALELIVVDQSPDDRTERALAELAGDPRLTVVRSDTGGISAARNVGLTVASGEVVGLTDDDCEVGGDWAFMLREVFAHDVRLGVVFGTVEPGPHDAASGFVPAALCAEPVTISKVSEIRKLGGMGACMAIRRSVWDELGGFDERLGTGTRIGAGEEGDFLLRSLAAGHIAGQTPILEVIHHGFRTWQEGRELIRRYWFGAGATLGIHLKSKPWSVGALLMALGASWISGPSVVASSLGDRPHRWLRLVSFARGFAVGLPMTPWGKDL